MITEDGRLKLPEVRIETTNICNASCTICPREKMTRPLVTMSLGFFIDLCDSVKRMGASHLGLFGFGEPLMDSTLVEKVKYATRCGLRTYLTTNGSLLGEFVAESLLEAGIKTLRFSIHGTKKRDYEAVHRGLQWETVIRNLKNFIRINDANGHLCSVQVSTILTNGGDPKKAAEFWIAKGADEVEIWRPHGWAGSKPELRPAEPAKLTCGRPLNGPLQIQSDGRVVLCCFLTNAEVILGDAKTQSLSAVLRGPELAEVQNAHKAGVYGSLPCSVCDQRNQEKESPLLYSTRDPERRTGRLSTSKIYIAKED